MKMNISRSMCGFFRCFGIALAACLVLAILGCRNPSSSDVTSVTVTGVIVSPSNASVDRNKTQQFSATVIGTGNPSQAVIWSVTGGGAGTHINNIGGLTVAANEDAETLTVLASSTLDFSKYGIATVTVTGAKITVSGVTVNPLSITVDKGERQAFSATVIGENDPAQTVTWTVEGGESNRTGINSSGILYADTDESATTLTVKATSTVDTTKSGTATVTIRTPPLTGVVYITGAARVGYTLTANTDNLYGIGTIEYQWKSSGTDIDDANERSYELVGDDQGKNITVTVTRAGYDGERTSDAVGPVQTAPATTGSVEGAITLEDGIENVSVSFSNADNNLPLSRGGTITVTVAGSYQAYQWFVDGVALIDEPFNYLALKGSDYTVGVHRILVIVYKNGVPYSQEIRFTVS
jgi:hypothetical protein